MQVYKVGEFIEIINDALRDAVSGEEIMVEGEISDYNVSHNKWVNFSLKDEEEEAVLKCFMTTFQMSQPLEDGMKIRIAGVPKIYPRFGNFSMNVSQYELVGEGALRRAFELLKKKLTEEGLFDTTRKRTIPRFPEKIGVITSREAAAYTDFLKILNNRWSGVEVELTPVHVQGKEAVKDIVGAFNHFNQAADKPDVIVLTRGGGSLEDLMAFNSEEVVRAVFGSQVPVVVGVGHERDESLADYAADIRASTPSNAAEIVVPDRREILYEIETMERHLAERVEDALGEYDYRVEKAIGIFENYLNSKTESFERTVRSLNNSVGRFASKVTENKTLIEERVDRLGSNISSWLAKNKEALSSITRLLQTIDPKNLLKKGYSIIKKKGQIIKSIKDIDIGDQLAVQLYQGSVDTKVTKKYDSQENKQQKIQFR